MTETITFEQVGDVLALAAARDQRTVGDGDILAWYDDLNAARVTYDDARAALTRFYVEQATLEPDQRFRATSPDVIRLARKNRAERLANFVYEPPAGETDPSYLVRLRAQRQAVASGQISPATHAPALEGRPHPVVAKQLEAVGRTVPDADDESTAVSIRRPGPLGVDCPTCHAPIGRPCKAPALEGRQRERPPHAARKTLAQGEPLPDPAAAAAEAERRRAASRRFLERQQEPAP